MLSWILTTYFGRRPIYLWGTGFNVIALIVLGITGSVDRNHASILSTASFGLIISVVFTLGAAPASWAIIGETSAIRLRPLTTGIGRATYYIVEIPCIFLAAWMLNPTGANRESAWRISRTLLISFSRWTMWLRLGQHCTRLLCRCLLLPPRNEGTIVPRNRHLVQAKGPC